MRIVVIIINIFFSSISLAQNPDSSFFFDKEYSDLLSYVPEYFEPDTTSIPQSRLLQSKLNTIGSLQMHDGLKEELKLSESDKKWLENRIEQIATALFLDGKRILIFPVGGYSGCPEKLIGTMRLNNIEIIELKFCHTCIDSNRDENFIRIFNDRMYSLIEIERH